jgi:hypothetical protein
MRSSWPSALMRNFLRVLKSQLMWCMSTKFACEFCGLVPLGKLARVDTTTLSCFNHYFLWISLEPLASSTENIHLERISWAPTKKFLNNDIYIRLAAVTINYHDGNSGYKSLWSRDFLVGIPLTLGFRPQLVVVSGLSVGIPLTVGF